MEYDFQKSRVTGPWDHKVSVSAKKVKKKCHACVPLNVYGVQARFQGMNSASLWTSTPYPAGTYIDKSQEKEEQGQT